MLIAGAILRLHDAVGVRALDQIVVAHHLLLARHRLIVAQEVDGVHVAIVDMPAAIVEHLRDAVPDRAAGGRLEAGLAPQTGEADRIVAAGVVPVDVEDLHRIAQLVIVAREMVAELDLLPPQREGLLLVAHPRLHRGVDDLLQGAEAVAAIGQPRIDDRGPADVLDADGAVRFPGLLV